MVSKKGGSECVKGFNMIARSFKWLGIVAMLIVGCSAAASTPTSPPSPTIIASTSTSIPSISATPTIIPVSPTTTTLPSLPTPEISPTPTLEPTPTPDLTSRLFTFFAVAGFNYSWQEPLTGLRDELAPSGFGLTPYAIGAASTLSFAHHSNQVAIWSRPPDEPGKLWLADIALREARLVYVDNDEIYSTDTSFPPQDMTLNWFPNDKYVVVQPTNAEAPTMLIDVTTGTYQENWPWECNQVITSPKTSKLAFLCTHDNEFLVMDWEGLLWTDAMLAEQEILWQWPDDYMWPLSPSGSIPPWSPDGSKTAFILADNPDTLIIMNSAGERMPVSLDVDILYPHTVRWIQDKKILVGGYREDWPASWFIVNSETGEIMWRLENVAEFGFHITSQEQAELNLITGEISASGQYLVLATSRTDVPAGNQLIMIDVENNRFLGTIADIGHGINAFAWGREE